MTRLEKYTDEGRARAHQYLDEILDSNDRLVAEREQKRTQAIASRAAILWMIGWAVLTIAVGLGTFAYFGILG